MESIRSIHEVHSNTIHIDLPPGFNAKKVEVVISPIYESNSNLSELQKVLLDAPTLTDEELQEIENAKRWMIQK